MRPVAFRLSERTCDVNHDDCTAAPCSTPGNSFQLPLDCDAPLPISALIADGARKLSSRLMSSGFYVL